MTKHHSLRTIQVPHTLVTHDFMKCHYELV